MSESRLPEAMPADWRVVTFAHEKGFGTLRHGTGEEVHFDYSAWNLGDWKPARKDQDTGPSSPLLPQPGEPVRVEWKRSATGKNVPRLVQPTGRLSIPRLEHKLSAWVKALQKHGRFTGLTAASLLKALARLDRDLAEEWKDGTPREAPDFAFLLLSIAHLASEDSVWGASHADWLYSDDHRWDRERASLHLPVMLGLPGKSVASAGDGRTTGATESLPDYVRSCNRHAEAAGLELRLYEVDLEGDAHVFVCLWPAAFEALVVGGYVPCTDHLSASVKG